MASVAHYKAGIPKNVSKYVMLVPENYNAGRVATFKDVMVGKLNATNVFKASLESYFAQNWGIAITPAFLNVSVAPANPSMGDTITFNVSGGTAPYTWSVPGCSPEAGFGAMFSCSLLTPGTAPVTVTDSQWAIASQDLAVAAARSVVK